VLIGGASAHWAATEAIDRAAVAVMSRPGPIAFLPTAKCPPEYGDTFLRHYALLGAPDGYVVPVHDASTANTAANAELIANASLVYIGGGDTTHLLESMAGSAALDALAAAYEEGAVIAGASAGAIAIASWGLPVDPSIPVVEGWGWLEDVIVSPHYLSERMPRLAEALSERPGALAIGLAEDLALALGPNGEIEEWGKTRVNYLPRPDAAQ
jgi:cyanophycinase